MGKTRTSKLWLLMAVVALLMVPVIGLAGCGDEEEEVEEAINEAIDQIDEEIQGVGDHTVEVTGFTCPLPPDAETGEPMEGGVLASVNVTIKNESDSELVIASDSFLLEDEEGMRAFEPIPYEGANALGMAETIAPGEEISGVLLFEVTTTFEPKYLVKEKFIGEPIKVELPEPEAG